MTRFLVLCASRTGSTMLAHMLNSHPGIRCNGEVLGPRRGQIGDRLVGVDYDADPGLRDRLIAQRDRDPAGFLQEWVYRAGGGGAVGFKIKYEELMKHDFKSVLEWLVGESSIKVIHLVRRNRLKRFVSEVTAVKIYGAFQLTDPEQKPTTPRFRLSPEECRADFEKQERREARFGRLFGEHDVLDITYEDLTAPGQASLAAIQKFVGVDPTTLRTPTLKLNPDGLGEVLENYDELKRAFRETRHASYFE